MRRTIQLILLFLISSFVFGQIEIKPIIGKSMEPAIMEGNKIEVDYGYEYEKLKVGDIIVWWNPHLSHYICHRIIYIDADGFITKGDFNPHNDGYVPDEAFRGFVKSIIKN